MSITKFTYNNFKNINISYIFFKINYKYYFQILYKKDINFNFKFKLANKLLVKLKKLIIICYKNFYYTQNFEKYIYNNKLKSNIFNNKFLLNNNYIKIK